MVVSFSGGPQGGQQELPPALAGLRGGPPMDRVDHQPGQAPRNRGVNLACNKLPYKIAALRDAHQVRRLGTGL